MKKQLMLLVTITTLFMACKKHKDDPEDPVAKAMILNSDDRVIGNATTAEVLIYTYNDSESPFCRDFAKVMKTVVQHYAGRVAWVYRHYPLESMHPRARLEALTLECIHKLKGNGAFQSAIDSVMTVNQPTDQRLTRIAESFSIDSATFWGNVHNPSFHRKIEDDITTCIQLEISGVPQSFFVNKRKEIVEVKGAYSLEEVKRIIVSLL